MFTAVDAMDIPRRRLMNRRRWIVALSTVFVVTIGFVWFVYRPWALYWGATADEISRAMPGDSVMQDPTFNATRGITIDAAPEHIWPWLVQMGYHRAGFYSYDRLDNSGIHSADTIMPLFQNLQVGDMMPLTRTGRIRVGILEPQRFLVLFFGGRDGGGGFSGGTWATGLYPVGPNETRMVTRLRARPVGIVQRGFMDLCEIVMMRKHMLGVKERAERLSSMTPAELAMVRNSFYDSYNGGVSDSFLVLVAPLLTQPSESHPKFWSDSRTRRRDPVKDQLEVRSDG